KALGGADLVPIRSSGDEGTSGGSGDAGGGGDKARFVREIERALLAGEVDIGVHSAKDLPTELPEGLEIAGVPTREDARDAYVGHVSSLGEVPRGSRIGTSSLRRRAQILALRPDLEILDLRGNVDTRLAKFEAGQFDGLVLAAAGLRRLGRAEEISFPIDPDEILPAPGQGALAIEVSHRNDRAAVAVESITDRGALATLLAERALVAALEASCNTPLGAYATLEGGGRMRLRAFCGLPDGSEWLRDELEDDASDPEAIGRALAERIRGAGGGEILRRAEGMTVSAG
ncbi:MAG TPA: hydroxymethylbilane synthase, partial [Solirubrobacterales bacterium]|nr:hydroxymethylbilane synthase [Solirubrobacterales bacterium]